MLVRLASVNDFQEWRGVARGLLLAGIRPDKIEWADPMTPPNLLDEATVPAVVTGRAAGRVPARFIRLAQAGICHSDSDRFALLYHLLWRLQKDRNILFNLDDTDVTRLNRRVEAVAAELARMKAELRFRRAVTADGHKGLVASFSPRRYVLEKAAPHFARAVAHEDWIITTPYRSAYWDGKRLTFGAGRGL